MRWTVSVIVLFLFLCSLWAQPALAEMSAQEQSVRRSLSALFLLAQREGTIASCVAGDHGAVHRARLDAKFTQWAKSQPRISESAYQALGDAESIFLYEEGSQGLRLVKVEFGFGRSGREFCGLTIEGWAEMRTYDVQHLGVPSTRTVPWRSGLNGPVVAMRPAQASGGPQPSTSSNVQSSIQELEDAMEALGALSGNNPTPSPRVMTQLVWAEPEVQRVVKTLCGTLLKYGGFYLGNDRQDFVVTILARLPNGLLQTTDLSFSRRSGRWQKAEPFVTQPAFLRPISHFVTFYGRSASLVEVSSNTLTSKLVSILLECDGRYSSRVQPSGLKTVGGDFVGATAPMEIMSWARSLRMLPRRALWCGAMEVSPGRAFLAIMSGKNRCLVDFALVNGSWVIRDWECTESGDDQEMVFAQLATIPATHLAALPQSAKRQTLREIAMTPLGALLVRFFRYLDMNSRQQVSNFLPKELVGQVYNQSWWGQTLHPLTRFTEDTVIVEVVGNSVTVEAGAYRLTGTLKANELTLRPLNSR